MGEGPEGVGVLWVFSSAEWTPLLPPSPVGTLEVDWAKEVVGGRGALGGEVPTNYKYIPGWMPPSIQLAVPAGSTVRQVGW